MNRFRSMSELLQEKWQQPYFRYLVAVSTVGWGLAIWGARALADGDAGIDFLLFLLLSIIAHIGTVNVKMTHNNISYSVAPAVSMAVMLLNGIWLAAVVENVSMIAMWLINQRDPKRWRKTIEQLMFNAGMGSLVIVVAGAVFYGIRAVAGPDSLVAMVVAWLIAAIVFDQLNLWLVIAIIKLQNPDAKPYEIWRSYWWASSINNAVLALGGGVLAYAGSEFGLVGILVFFLPVLLSAYAFRLYVRQMEDHMAHLEEIVSERTGELAGANATLHELGEQKNAFLAILAHDMKSPLTTISLYGELIKRYPERLIAKPTMADAILDSQEVLATIVSNILDLEKLAAGGSLTLNQAAVDVVQLLDATIELVQAQAERKEMTVARASDVSFLNLYVDADQFQRAITNLLSNAIKYSPDGSHVDLRLTTAQDVVQIAVIDSGYGIPADDLPHVFERFRRVSKHKRMAAGTGLGLSITNEIIKAHGGTITVASVEGEGSTFTVTLPLTPTNPIYSENGPASGLAMTALAPVDSADMSTD